MPREPRRHPLSRCVPGFFEGGAIRSPMRTSLTFVSILAEAPIPWSSKVPSASAHSSPAQDEVALIWTASDDLAPANSGATAGKGSDACPGERQAGFPTLPPLPPLQKYVVDKYIDAAPVSTAAPAIAIIAFGGASRLMVTVDIQEPCRSIRPFLKRKGEPIGRKEENAVELDMTDVQSANASAAKEPDENTDVEMAATEDGAENKKLRKLGCLAAEKKEGGEVKTEELAPRALAKPEEEHKPGDPYVKEGPGTSSDHVSTLPKSDEKRVATRKQARPVFERKGACPRVAGAVPCVT